MENLKLHVKSSFRTEMFAAGLYSTLAGQYGRKDSALYHKLKEASEQEHKHGRIFNQFFKNRFNENAGSEKLWVFIGKFAGFVIRPVPLKKKLRSLADKESAAVTRIEERLKYDGDPSYLKILSHILPDEKSHAAIYDGIFA